MKQYIVDAFTDRPFFGNPAAVCVMDRWPSEESMMLLAMENNLSETAFIVKEPEGYHLRWFTPGTEIELCGHATLASAFVILTYYEPGSQIVQFNTLSGVLTVKRSDHLFEMDFPAYKLRKIDVTDQMEDAIGVRPLEAYIDRDLLLVLPDAASVRNLIPDQEKLLTLDGLITAVTAPSDEEEFDCVSRMFVPKLGIPEDPVTGSAHCMVTPYWCGKLGKENLTCFQASERTGILYTGLKGNRVCVAGKAVLFSRGTILEG